MDGRVHSSHRSVPSHVTVSYEVSCIAIGRKWASVVVSYACNYAAPSSIASRILAHAKQLTTIAVERRVCFWM
eukprot:scaffold163793_cov43-Tisochrysis_lutea.AAC.2